MKGKKRKSTIYDDQLVISSDFSNLSKVEKFSQRISKKARLTEDQGDNLAIALTELVNNAIIHGNKSDPSKQVAIFVQYKPDRVEVSVLDEGEGFDPATLQNPTDPENLWKENGRGIFLVQHLIDDLIFEQTPQGLLVTMVISLRKATR
ncbi:MAG: ATP-binding protein [Calditrichaeota bacterium]|nr:ATP-binding protein [Calditrichota bacterium]